MSTKRALWMAKDPDGTVCLFSKEPSIHETYNCWCGNGWVESIKDLLPDSKHRTIISKTIKKPWRESKCRVFVTIKEA